MNRNSRVAGGHAALIAGGLAAALFVCGYALRGADQPTPTPARMFQQYCFACHGDNLSHGGNQSRQAYGRAIRSRKLSILGASDLGARPETHAAQRNAAASDDDRAHATGWIHSQLDAYVKAHAGDPGRVTVRRLTSGEYNYAIHDLTGLDLDLGIDASNDSVGGEGFTNFGDVQFMQDANLQRYLEAAKIVADHAVVGAGPIQFYSDPGKTGFEMSAIHRIKDIYTKYGFRTVSGEGGFSFGLERYAKAMFAAWEYQHRAALGKPNATLASLAAKEGLTRDSSNTSTGR